MRDGSQRDGEKRRGPRSSVDPRPKKFWLQGSSNLPNIRPSFTFSRHPSSRHPSCAHLQNNLQFGGSDKCDECAYHSIHLSVCTLAQLCQGSTKRVSYAV